VEDIISGHKDKIHTKEKTEEFLDKRLKSCERSIQEFSDFIKRLHLPIMVIKGEEVKNKSTHNILIK
jgi:hypothetical protein